MRLTYKGDYSLKAILYLAIHYGRETITIHEIAEHIDAPVKFLEQVLLDLKKGGFVESRRGKVGGYLLSKTPGDIKLGDVVRFVDGPIEPVSCVKEGYSDCSDVYRCVFRKIWQDVSEATSNILDNITFEKLVSEANSRQQPLVYSI